MSIDLYYVPGSGPCRSVRLVAAAVGVDLNLKLTNLMAKEQLKPEFLKMNPQHTVPTLDDNGFYLWESRAICMYLVEKYGKDDSLYPKDPNQRALINQRLYFDMGTLYEAFAQNYYPQLFAGAPEDPEKVSKIHEALEYLEKFLENQNYTAGDNLTLADLVLAVSVSNFEVVDFDISKYKNTSAWMARIKSEAPKYEEINGEGLRAFKELIDKLKNLRKTMNGHDNLKMVVTLYQIPASGPCRAVRLVAASIGVNLELKVTNLLAKDHYKPEFVKMNPQHTVPTMDDNGFYLWESRAICTYLIEKYAKNDSLYPKNPKQRAIVNQRLYFDFGTLYQPFVDYYILPLLLGKKADETKVQQMEQAFKYLDLFLDNENYVAGKSITVADIVILTSVSNYTIFDYDMSKYPNVTRWFEKLQSEVPKYKEINESGLKEYKAFVQFLKNK
ncbi:PREDICTED: uncharacterized protein LOC105362421 [Ceratosolen solmsi marchali]|uniref:Uncharacterized protein LOC105362421 n=1 Tax=Ceratosolen solmsi marchali TaxID=326594 RepID=A0AAJ7DVQ5_9HYME|nr:PREDICTED: uncharacterized protein LOC105362421 [Ceratosolen solmsi marchali]